MSSMARKVDDNQMRIVKELRKLPGITVDLDHDDILLGYKKKTWWFEVKNPDRCLNKDGKLLKSALRPSQEKLLKEWKGQYKVVWSVKQILEEIGYETGD